MIDATKRVVYFAIACSMALLFWQIGCQQGERKKAKQVERAKDAEIVPAKKWTDKDGNRHTTKEVVTVDADVAKALYKREFDSVCRLLNITRKQLVNISKIDAYGQGSFTAPIDTIVIHDTIDALPVEIKMQHFIWQDSFAKIEGYIQQATDTTSDTVKCYWSVKVPIDYSIYWERKHKFLFIRYGRKLYYVDVISENPNIEFLNLKTIQVNE